MPKFLNCLFGSLRFKYKISDGFIVSKLPIRQFTQGFILKFYPLISKLPIRQFTHYLPRYQDGRVSKLPIRQFTAAQMYAIICFFSKLPIRQFTFTAVIHAGRTDF